MTNSDTAEVVRRGFAGLASGGVEALLPFVDEEFEMVTPPELASEPGAYHGHDGLKRWFDSFYDAMDEVRLDATTVEDLGEEVMVDLRITARGRTSGLEMIQETTALCVVADGRLRSMRFFADRDAALAAAGP